MASTPKDTIFLTDDHRPHKGPYLCLWSDDEDLVERFRQLAYLTLPKSLGWFHQCSSSNYHMFEFWRPNLDQMKAEAERFALELSLPVQINLSQEY